MINDMRKCTAVKAQAMQSAKRSRDGDLNEVRKLLREAKECLYKAEQILETECDHTDCVKVLPNGPRDNG